jgi:hypothetical protein
MHDSGAYALRCAWEVALYVNAYRAPMMWLGSQGESAPQELLHTLLVCKAAGTLWVCRHLCRLET